MRGLWPGGAVQGEAGQPRASVRGPSVGLRIPSGWEQDECAARHASRSVIRAPRPLGEQGTLPESPNSYQLDSQYNFQTGKWYEVCGNTAAMVAESWLAPHFEVVGDRSVHYGMFVCGAAAAAAAAPAAAPVAVVVARGMAAAARPCGPCCK